MPGEIGGGYVPPEATKQITQNNHYITNMSEEQKEIAKKNIMERGYITEEKWGRLTDEQKKKFIETEINRDVMEYSSEILGVVENMKKRPATGEDLQRDMLAFTTELKERDPEKGGMLEKRLGDTDKTTGIPRRDSQNDILKSEAFKRIKSEDRETTSRTLGMVSFDLRSLKLLNDAVSDHTVGDEYLRRVAERATEVSKKVSELLGVNFTLARDGGDEFSVIFTSENVDLEQNLEDNSELQNLLTEKLESGKTRAIDAISAYLTQEVGKETHNELFLDADERKKYEALKKEGKLSENDKIRTREIMKEKLEKFVNKGIEDPELHFKMPDNFDLHSYVAAGASTLHETLNRPETEDYKNYGAPENELHALSILTGAMRAKSDRESYRQKERQNQEMTAVQNEENAFRVSLLSRNEFTRSIIVEKKKIEIALYKCLNDKKAQ